MPDKSTIAIELSKDILSSTIHNDDKLSLLQSLLCDKPLFRDNTFKLETRERALELKIKVFQTKNKHQI